MTEVHTIRADAPFLISVVVTRCGTPLPALCFALSSALSIRLVQEFKGEDAHFILIRHCKIHFFFQIDVLQKTSS